MQQSATVESRECSLLTVNKATVDSETVNSRTAVTSSPVQPAVVEGGTASIVTVGSITVECATVYIRVTVHCGAANSSVTISKETIGGATVDSAPANSNSTVEVQRSTL